MTRLPVVVALSLAFSAAAATAQSPQKSIAERLSSLREGWSLGSKAEAADTDAKKAPAYKIAQRPRAASVPRVPANPTSGRVAATANGQKTSFPRVKPSELMPRNWFGIGSKKTSKPVPPTEAPALQAKKQETPPVLPEPTARITPPAKVVSAAPSGAVSTRGSTGSARSRLLRDVQRTSDKAVAAAEPAAPRVAQARVGSVLSANSAPITPSRRTVAANNARLARSIAAEVANSIGSTSSQEARETAETVTQDTSPVATFEGPTPTETKATASEPAAPEIAKTEDDPITPIEPEDDEPAAPVEAVAKADSGQIVVSAKPEPTRKLPLFIGDRYSKYEDASIVATSKPAQEAFSKPSPSEVTGQATTKTVPDNAEDDLLFTQRMPVLVSKVLGPKTITVCREATYRVLLANRGDVGADQVVTRITIPKGAEVVGTKAAAGVVDRSQSASGNGTLVWRADHLAASGMAKLDVRLIARTGKPIELGVTHSHQPIDGRTLVQVQEPKLELELVGPDEVLYGKPQTYRLTISNPGTGAAENVRLHLTPPGGDTDRKTSHDFGLIAAGEESTVEIELTAREAGQLAINAAADADGDVTCAITKEVFCRRPQLVVDWRGPSDRYAGAPAVYYFRVRNPGTAVAPGVVLSVDLPDGFEVLPGQETPTVHDNRIAYQAGALRPGDDKYFELRGILRQGGANEIALRAAGSDETRSERVIATTEVVALADLKLDVLDPKGPVATGEEIAYEIRVTNRGSNDARDVRVVGLFSEGIEPHHVEGATSETIDGRVAFDVIDRIAAGEERVFTIHARAYEEGTHLFRAEVLCRDLEIKLAAEETTRFFEDEAINVAVDGYPSGNTNSFYPR